MLLFARYSIEICLCQHQVWRAYGLHAVALNGYSLRDRGTVCQLASIDKWRCWLFFPKTAGKKYSWKKITMISMTRAELTRAVGMICLWLLVVTVCLSLSCCIFMNYLLGGCWTEICGRFVCLSDGLQKLLRNFNDCREDSFSIGPVQSCMNNGTTKFRHWSRSRWS